MSDATFLNLKENTLFSNKKKLKAHFGKIFTCNFPFSLLDCPSWVRIIISQFVQCEVNLYFCETKVFKNTKNASAKQSEKIIRIGSLTSLRLNFCEATFVR